MKFPCMWLICKLCSTTGNDNIPPYIALYIHAGPPIVITGDNTLRPPTEPLSTELERDAVIAAAVSTVLGVLIIIAILGVIAFLLVMIVQKRQKQKNMIVENVPEKPASQENPLYTPALGNVDLPTTPKTPKEIRFQNMYSE